MNSKKDKKRFLIAAAIVACIIFIINYLTPYLADDYNYLLHKSNGIQTLKEFYFSWGGRVEPYVLLLFLSYLPPVLFDILNTAVYMAVTWLIYRICKGDGNSSISLYLGIHLMLWFCVPDYGQVMFWMCGSVNYLWPSLFVLSLISYYRNYADKHYKKSNIIRIFFAFLGGAVAGGAMENMSFGMLVIIGLYLLYYRRAKIRLNGTIIAGSIGSIIGFLFLVLSPGNFIRSMANEKVSKIFLFFVINYYWVMCIGILVVIWLILRLIVKNIVGDDKGLFEKIYYQSVIFCVGAAAAAYCMLAAPTSPERTWFIVCVYAVVAIGILYSKINLNPYPQIRKMISVAILGISCIVLVEVADTMISSYEIYVQTEEREKDILEQKAQGNLDVKTKIISHKYPLRANHDALYGLSDISPDSTYWINISIANYYGVKSVTGTADNDLTY